MSLRLKKIFPNFYKKVKLIEYNFELIDIFDLNYRNDVLIQFDGIFKNKSKNLINFDKLIK